MSSNTQPIISLRQVTKRYPGVTANDAIDLEIHAGEVHVLLGENGAGKSTLIGVLSGMVSPDEGEIVIEGEPVGLESPRHALDLGIGTVYQHSQLVSTLSVLDNLMLGNTSSFSLNRTETLARFQEFTELLDIDIDPRVTVSDLSLGQRQQVEIVSALWRGRRLLILDEPTSMLTPQGVEALGRVVRRLAGDGLAVIFITHKLNEVLDIADLVTVLRRGKHVGTITREEMTELARDDLRARMIEMMFGPEGTSSSISVSRQSSGQGPPRLRLERVTLNGDGPTLLLDEVSLDVGSGEIVGIAGIDGNGQKALAEVIAGQRLVDSGQVLLDDEPIHDLSVAERNALGVRYVTDDRKGEGTVGPLDIATNSVLKRIGQPPFWRSHLIRREPINEFAEAIIADHDVRAPNSRVPISKLSGGNIQKIVVGRELSMGPRVVVYNKPTYGLDVKTIRAILDRIIEQANDGTSTVFISTELEELIACSDRIAVMHRSRITGIVKARPGIEHELGRLMTGGDGP